MTNVLNNKNLQKGIDLWYTTTWPRDFHNNFYQDLHLRRQHGLNTQWWSPTVDDLWRWKAIRPLKKGIVLARGQNNLEHLQRGYAGVQGILGNRTPSLSNLDWKDVANLYHIVSRIKNVNSPVFGSKLCHFIMPDAFPVMDSNMIEKLREVTGVSAHSYQDYWQFCKSQWVGCVAQDQLVRTMQKAIGPNIFLHYPYAAKITELCLSGN